MSNIDRQLKPVIDKIYGKFASDWRPKAFADTKSRYLWTDAYGVVNFLSLYCLTKSNQYLDQAAILVNAVHNTLGKNRQLTRRLGESTEERPTLGGLRIGKPHDEGQSMEGDGQYYHYLTKWMFALNRLTLVTKDPKYNQWAVDLIKAVHNRFLKKSDDGQPIRMYWKMSIDLSRPLVASMGGLDPFDGYVMYRIVSRTLGNEEVLKTEIADLKHLVDNLYTSYTTHDSLDAGEALWLCSWFPEETWSQHLYQVANRAVNRMWDSGEFQGGARNRLAFREFGTSIGAQMHPRMMQEEGWAQRVKALNDFWLGHLYERDSDITPTMYCTSCFPGLFDPKFTVV